MFHILWNQWYCFFSSGGFHKQTNFKLPSFHKPLILPPLGPTQMSSSPCPAPLLQYFLLHPCQVFSTKGIQAQIPKQPVKKWENVTILLQLLRIQSLCHLQVSEETKEVNSQHTGKQIIIMPSNPIETIFHDLLACDSPSCQWSLCRAPPSLQNPTWLLDLEWLVELMVF